MVRSPLLWLGIAALLAYWVSVHPPGGIPGYSEDLCVADLSRQMMSEQIAENGGPAFRSSTVMYPAGSSVPFMSWSMERDWMGSYFWKWAPTFPFLWAYFGLSMLASFLIVGFLLQKIGLGKHSAWGLAALVVVAHIPRHFKIWHHFEHIPQHWIYVSLFLDAWIWQRLWRDRKWSPKLELWRGFAVLGTLGTAGYFWGPLMLEWILVRLALGLRMLWLRKKGIRIQIEKPARSWLFPATLCAVWVVLVLRWLRPLAAEAETWGSVWQPVGWYADWPGFFRPLWLELLPLINPKPIDWSETLVSVGWFLLVPAFAGLWFLARKKQLGRVAPFLALLVVAFLYLRDWPAIFNFHSWVQSSVPFMRFFRVASRWGLLMPQIMVVIIALSWPELSKAFKSGWRKPIWKAVGLVFLISSVIELRWLAHPVNGSAPMPEQARQLLAGVAAAPGTAVLDLPFCVAGGNGYCTGEQCPNYPGSTMTECLRLWHGKKIYGLYQARMGPAQCQVYQQTPYTSWFSAWREKRCFTTAEWGDFCAYLDSRPELAAVILYPEVWEGGTPLRCLQEFQTKLGAPIATAVLSSSPTRGYHEAGLTRMERYAAKCRR